MTQLLIRDNAFEPQFWATVTACTPTPQGFEVILDQTGFFPEGGGQSSDAGTLNEAAVSRVWQNPQGIVHLCREPLSVGQRVEGKVDAARRRRLMQHHTGEHVLSGLIHSRFGYDNVGFHLNTEYMTLDCNGPLSPRELEELELASNAVVQEDRPIRAFYPSPQEAAGLTYRSKMDIEADLRLVEIQGVDRCACCAPHLESTGQIGLIKIAAAEHYKKGMRLTVCCGQDAVALSQRQQSQLQLLARHFSIQPEKLMGVIQSLEEQTQKSAEALRQCALELARLQAQSQPGKDLFLVVSHLSPADRAKLAQELAGERGGLCAVLEEGPKGLSGAVANARGGLKERQKEWQQTLGAKGGGSDTLLHASFTASRQEVEAGLFE